MLFVAAFHACTHAYPLGPFGWEMIFYPLRFLFGFGIVGKVRKESWLVVSLSHGWRGCGRLSPMSDFVPPTPHALP